MRGDNRTSDTAPCWQISAICFALAAITFAVFARTLGFAFVNFDDNDYVYNNPAVASGLTWKGIAWAFRDHANNWHPLTWMSHMLDCQFYGLHPAGHHFTNVLLHTATVVALFLTLRAATGAVWRSAFVAAVFAIHPLRAESVAWISERKDVLSGLFFVLTIAAYLRCARAPWTAWRYALVTALFALGLMAKPMLVTMPLILLLLDFWPLRRNALLPKLFLEKAPLFVLSAAAALMTIIAQQSAIHTGASISIGPRVANATVAAMVYLREFFWPSGLAVYYPYPFGGYSPWEIALAFALLSTVTAAAWMQRRKQPWLFVGWFWYLIMLIPVVGMLQIGGQAHADRYTYLPQIGIVLAIAWSFGKSLAPSAAGLIMATVLAALVPCAIRQVSFWQNSETLWERDLACTTDNELAHDNLAALDLDKGNIAGAISHYREAERISPKFELTHLYLAGALAQKGNFADAISEYKTALQLNPADVSAQYNLAWLLATAPQPALRNGPEALRLSSQANQATGGKSAVILRTLAAAFAATGRYPDAAKAARNAIALARASHQDELANRLALELRRYQEPR